MEEVGKIANIEVEKKEKSSLLNDEKEKVTVKRIIENFIKRTIDILAGIVGTILLVPITIGIYIARKILKEDDGPIFYEQLRIGKNGKEFKIYKYRSMVMHADEKLWEYLNQNEEAREEYFQYKKLKNDPRITKLGKFLRRTSIDEFPQFINILKGDMSLVGPRPYLYREKEDMENKYQQIITVKPGLTGLWQVSGRSGVTFEGRIAMDINYIKNRNLWLDFKILLKTILKVFTKRGAI